jgi:predicted dehydrogenase
VDRAPARGGEATVIRAALIGLGWWGGELANAGAKLNGRLRIAACASLSAEETRAFAARIGARPLDGYEAALAASDIDAVMLATPHSLHAEQVIAAAEAGKHVFVEKPFTLTAASGRAVAEACARAGVVLAVGHNRRFSAGARAIKDLVERGALGTILHVEGHFSSNSAMRYLPEQWRARRLEAPGGALASIGLHLIDVMAWLFGPIEQVTCQARRRAVAVDIDDTTSALLRFRSGVTGYLGTHFACPLSFHFHVAATEANAEARADFTELVLRRGPTETEAVPLQPVDTPVAELDAFVDACEGGAPFPITPEEAVHNVAVLEALVRSASNESAWERVG